MKTVGIFTTFFETESGYSLISVAETQIRMLLDHEYDPVVLVQEGQYCEDQDGNVLDPIPFKEAALPSIWNSQTLDLRPALPALKLDGSTTGDFEDRVDRIGAVLEQELKDVEACITHDIILLDTYLPHNVAMRRYADKRPDLLWLHWIHSCPTPNNGAEYPVSCRHTAPPGYIVYPNDSDRGRVAQAFQLGTQQWRIQTCRAGHAIDPLLIVPYTGLTKDLVKKADLLNGDVVAIYPIRLDRGKQPEKIIRLMAGVKQMGYEPRLLILDWQSMGEHFQDYINELTILAVNLGVGTDISFTSRLDDRCSQGVPRQTVLELMGFSNVYIHPSKIETYSLTVHEAALRGNLLVLNYDLPPMRELFGNGAIYMDFGSDRVPRDYTPSEQGFWGNEARRLVAELKQSRIATMKLKAMKEWTPQAMWIDFEPLLYLRPIGTI